MVRAGSTGRHQFLITLLLVCERKVDENVDPAKLGGCARLSLTWGLEFPVGVGWVGPAGLLLVSWFVH